MTVEIAALFLVLGAIALVLAYTLVLGAPPTPTSPRVRRLVVKMVPAGLEGTVHELGCGWGGLAVALARSLPGCRVVAWELSPLPWLVARLRPHPANLEVRRGDFLEADFEGTALAVCYLHPGGMESLKRKLVAALPSGTPVLCHTFAIRGWTPETEQRAEDLYRSPVFLYRVP